MNLNIVYLPNKTAKSFITYLENEGDDFNCHEVDILGKNCLLIEINDISSNAKKTINTPSAIKNCWDKERMAEILGINRILYGSTGQTGNINKVYKVLICDMACVSIQSKNRGREKSKYIKERENSQVVEFAKKVVYLLGLDLGMAYVAVTGKRRLKVIDVDPSPLVRDKDLKSIMKKLQHMYAIDDYIKNTEVVLGADPEFMMLNAKNGKMLAASNFFPREGTVGCDSIRIPNRQQRPIAELRPKPESSPLDLIANIKDALKSANRMAPYRNVKWLAGSQPIAGYSIGGHIHFSKTKLNASILRALDNYIGIPVFLIENPHTAAKRRKKYGFLCDYRTKNYGGFEYRTPGSWLISQEISTAVLCLAKIVASNYPFLSHNYLNCVEAQRAFYEGNQDYFRPIFSHLWANLKELDMYKVYAKELSVFPDMISNSLYWDEKLDFRKAWKITASLKKYNKNSEKPARASSSASSTNINQSIASAHSQNRIVNNNRSRRLNSNRITNVSPVRASSPASTNRSRNNPPSGRIIRSSQVRRSHIIR